jgi:hypothetical protein
MSPARCQSKVLLILDSQSEFNSGCMCNPFGYAHCVYYRIAWDVRMAADSTMLRMVNLLIALSLGVHREQLEQRMGLTWPRPFLLRPL